CATTSAVPGSTSTYHNAVDDKFVVVSPSKYDTSINEFGLMTSYSQEKTKRIWFTKLTDISHIVNADDFETALYKQSLWEVKKGSFSNGATIREIMDVPMHKAAGITNKINGVRQWYTTTNIPPSSLRVINRIR